MIKWELLPDGGYTYPNWNQQGEVTLVVMNGGSELEMWHSDAPDSADEFGALPDTIRLCQAVEVPAVWLDAPDGPGESFSADTKEWRGEWYGPTTFPWESPIPTPQGQETHAAP